MESLEEIASGDREQEIWRLVTGGGGVFPEWSRGRFCFQRDECLARVNWVYAFKTGCMREGRTVNWIYAERTGYMRVKRTVKTIVCEITSVTV